MRSSSKQTHGFKAALVLGMGALTLALSAAGCSSEPVAGGTEGSESSGGSGGSTGGMGTVSGTAGTSTSSTSNSGGTGSGGSGASTGGGSTGGGTGGTTGGACPAGTETCPCLPGDTCDAGLTCSNGACVLPGMVWVPPGPFLMGCTQASDPDCVDMGPLAASPLQEVTLSGFQIDRTEVTQAEYAACMDAGECTAHGTGSVGCEFLYVFDPATTPDLPMQCVSWEQAAAYCAWVGKRLPTEAQWEKAARGTDGRRYPWGDAPPDCTRTVFWEDVNGESGCGAGGPQPVGSRPAGASPYGALDMAGNVDEWTADWIAPYPEPMPPDYAGPADGPSKVVRGGLYLEQDLPDMRVHRRSVFGRQDSDVTTGFRCAR